MRNLFLLFKLLTILLLLLTAACSSLVPSRKEPSPPQYISAEQDGSLLSKFAPLFIIEEPEKTYNLIGTPALRTGSVNQPVAYIDPTRPSIYTMQRSFTVHGNSYRNLIYRVHFEKTPYRHLTAGKNVGLIIVVTLDASHNPRLITTVHTCGCYLGIIPTTHLPSTAYPKNWSVKEQRVYGESLPGQISIPQDQAVTSLAFRLRGGTHRVMDVFWAGEEQLKAAQPAPLKSMQGLRQLPFGEQTDSFFETSGPRKGYVRNSHKPYERLLMSWWAFDWRIGEDKDFGPREQIGTIFYTSLKFWDRDESDMWNFSNFLDYWGWKL